MEEDMKTFTVTATGTYFVNAHNVQEAIDIIYEALLGNDINHLLGWGEVHLSDMKAEEGYHSVIEREN